MIHPHPRTASPVALLAIALFVFSCDGDSPTEPRSGSRACAVYPPWETSPYVLPFPVGSAFRISQGNCTRASHQGTLSFSYDIEMPFGSVVTAARDGVVVGVRVDQPTGSRGLRASNYLQIRHADGLVTDYVHLAPEGNLVRLGQFVQAGQPIALTGDTGDVGSFPHVHFNVSPCGDNLSCNTEPVTFRNTTPNPNGLIENQVYPALPFER